MDHLRANFERLNSDSQGFARSRKGTYKNPSIARDWKWFQLGAIAASRQEAPAASDTFRGDNSALVSNINALLSLDADGALVPHGIGGLARELLSAAASRLSAPTAARSPATVAQPVTLTEDVLLGKQVWFDRKDVRRVLSRLLTYLRIPKGPLAGRLLRAQPCPSQGCGGDGGEALKQAAADAVKWLNSWFSNHDGNKIADKLSAALSGLEHVGKESE